MKSSKMKFAALLVAAMGVTGLAQAQSHSVANWSNPPGTQADSKAATEATPGKNAKPGHIDGRDNGKQAADAAANKGKKGKAPVKMANHKAKASSPSTGSSGSGTTSSSSATTPVTMDGASKGGAEATMQAEPSRSTNNNVEQGAFDNGSGKK